MNDTTCPIVHKLKLLTGFIVTENQLLSELSDTEIDYLYDNMYDDQTDYHTIQSMLDCLMLQVEITKHFKNDVLSVHDIVTEKYYEGPTPYDNGMMMAQNIILLSRNTCKYEPMDIVYINNDVNRPWVYYKNKSVGHDYSFNELINNYKYLIRLAEEKFGGYILLLSIVNLYD
jgi:hypothetical protein